MIRLEHVTKTFNEGKPNAFSALEDVTMHVHQGEVVVLKGVSGSGKSTLLSVIASMLKPTSGSVNVRGEAISKLPDYHASMYRNRHIGFVFQSFNLFDRLSVRENIALPLLVNEDVKQMDDAVIQAMERANIVHKADQYVQDLSGGEKQRCAIARALVNDPEIILCDEPTANLDHHNSLNFLESVEMLKRLGKTVVIATHDPVFETLSAVDRYIEIEDGRIRSS